MIAFAIACAVAAALTPVARRIGFAYGLVDRPNQRSSHAVPTARSGGIAVVAAILVTFAALQLYVDGALLTMTVLALAISVLGILDDKLNLAATWKLVVQLVLALVFVAPFVRSALLPAVIALVWIAGVTNFFNFMDGINGIASLEAVVCGIAMGLLLLRSGDAPAAALAFAVAGAAAGFFPWNGFTGWIFMGDVGSLPLGFILGALVVRGARDGVPPWIMAAPLLPFLLDTGLTLVRRVWRREAIFQAHRTHFYQQLTDLVPSHLLVASLWTALAVAAAAVALLHPTPVAFAAIVAVHVVVFAIIVIAKKSTQHRP